MIKALVGVAVLLAAAALLTVAFVANPFHKSARPGPSTQEFAAAARVQCGGKQAVPTCVRLVSERIAFKYQAFARSQCGGRQAKPVCIRLVRQRLGLHS